MNLSGGLRHPPLAALVIAVAVAFAVVCPVMAAPGAPADQKCHSEPEPAAGDARTAPCCSSVTGPRSFQAEPGALPALPVLAPTSSGVRTGSDVRRRGRKPRAPALPLFARHAALLI